MTSYKIEGMAELERSLKQLARVPQTVATQAARSGATIALKAARSKAPIDTGQLRSGIIMKGERKTITGKKVYDVMMNPAMNNVFVKMVQNPVQLKGNRAYYPASQEYGFRTANGGYIPGYGFLKSAMVNNKVAIESKMVAVASKAVDKALRGR